MARDPFAALVRAARLEQLGVTVRSPELERQAAELKQFYERGGNRAMRRQAARAQRRRR